MPVFDRILVATDFSEASGPALDLAVALAHGASRLIVVTVAELPSTVDLSAPVDLLTPLADAADQQLTALLARVRARRPQVEGIVRVGVAWEQILAAAAELGADLVVLGTHGRRGLAHVVLGSVAERVVQLSPVPVLTVRASGPRARGS